MAELPPARGDRHLAIVARLAPEARSSAAEDALRRLSGDLAARYPQTNRGNKDQPDAPRRITPVRYSQLDPSAGDQIRLIAIVIGGASALLLTSACLNVGSLLLSAALARRGELAVKMALGATRERLVRQLLTEALFLSVAGGALGLLFALWTSTAIPALFMVEQAEQLDTGLDASAMLLTVGVATLAGVLFAIAPALQGTSAPAVTALRADAGGISAPRGGSRLRAWLVGGQIALSTALLLATGLAVSSLAQALDAGLGVDHQARSVCLGGIAGQVRRFGAWGRLSRCPHRTAVVARGRRGGRLGEQAAGQPRQQAAVPSRRRLRRRHRHRRARDQRGQRGVLPRPDAAMRRGTAVRGQPTVCARRPLPSSTSSWRSAISDGRRSAVT